MVVRRVTRCASLRQQVASSASKVLLGMLDGEARGGVAEGHGVSGSLVRSHGKTWPTGGFPPTCAGGMQQSSSGQKIPTDRKRPKGDFEQEVWKYT